MNAQQAEIVAAIAHQWHKYGNEPYLEAHVRKVVQRVIAAQGSEDAIVVAWLHDVLEDGAMSLESIPMLELTRAQAVALVAVTRKEGEPYALYIARVVQDPVARLVKFCDLLQNLSCQPREELRRRYLAALDLVRASLDNYRDLPQRSMMRSAAAAAAEVDRAQVMAGWVSSHTEARAAAVLHWCNCNDWPVDSRVTPRTLGNAMARMPYWSQGPSNYFDMARALSAAFLVS